MEEEKSPWMTTKEVADYLKHSWRTIEDWRLKKLYPELVWDKKGSSVRYLRVAVENFYKVKR